MLTTNVLKQNGKTLDYRNCQYRDLCGKRDTLLLALARHI